jgi:hypothetical protein
MSELVFEGVASFFGGFTLSMFFANSATLGLENLSLIHCSSDVDRTITPLFFVGEPKHQQD